MSSRPALFPRTQRLDGPHAYAAVFAFKCWASGKYFRVYAMPNARRRARLGVVVTKRIEPRAVGRNQAKRLVREVFRQFSVRLPAVDMVVRPGLALRPIQLAAARAELRDLLEQAARRCSQRSTIANQD